MKELTISDELAEHIRSLSQPGETLGETLERCAPIWEAARSLEQEGLIEKVGDTWRLTDRGCDQANSENN